MTKRIEAILFDLGDTLGRLNKSEDEKIQGVYQVIELLGSNHSPAEFIKLLSSRAKAYNQWADLTLTELNEEEIWTNWMLPDWPADQVSIPAKQLNKAWRDAIGSFAVLPETREVITQLFRRGYHLGLVSNTTSSTEVPRVLDGLGISGCFESVVLSCMFGKRESDPSMMLFAAEQMGVLPEYCAYIGNRIYRGVLSSRKAGYAMTIILQDAFKRSSLPEDPHRVPDHLIDNLKELLDIFPPHLAVEKPGRSPRTGKISEHEMPSWNATL